MPLPTSPISRRRLHERRIVYEGFQREDGLIDIEAHLVDVKDHAYELITGTRPPGEAIHDMSVRVTIDGRFVIQAIDAAIDSMPYPDACDRIEPAYACLRGANLLHGFRKRLRDDLGSIRGCTHLTELLGALPTAAVQAYAGEVIPVSGDSETRPFQLDRCHALRTDGGAVAKYYPRWAVARADDSTP